MSAIESLKKKAREWAAKVVELDKTPVPPKDQAEKDRLLRWAKIIKNSVEKVFGAVDEFDQIGAVPVLIPIAAIGAAAAAITKWTLDYQKFMAKINLKKDLEASGVSPAKAVRIINELENKSSFAGTILNKVALPIFGLSVLWHFVRK